MLWHYLWKHLRMNIYHLSPWRKAFVDLRQRRKHFIFSFTATAQLVWLGKKTIRNMTALCLKEAEHNNPRSNNTVLKICTFFKHKKPMSSFAFFFLSLLNLCVIKGQRSCSCSSSRESRHTQLLSADMRDSTGRLYTSEEHSVAVVNSFMFPNGSILGQAANWETKWTAGSLFESIQASFISNNLSDRLRFPSRQRVSI